MGVSGYNLSVPWMMFPVTNCQDCGVVFPFVTVSTMRGVSGHDRQYCE